MSLQSSPHAVKAAEQQLRATSSAVQQAANCIKVIDAATQLRRDQSEQSNQLVQRMRVLIANLTLIQQGRANEIQGEKDRQHAARASTPRTPARPAPAAPLADASGGSAAGLPARAGSPSAVLAKQLRSASPAKPFLQSSSPSMQPHLPPSPQGKGGSAAGANPRHSPAASLDAIAPDEDAARIAGILQSAEGHLRTLSPTRPPPQSGVVTPPTSPHRSGYTPAKPASLRSAGSSPPTSASSISPSGVTSAQRVAQLDDIISRLEHSTASLGSA